MLLFLVDLINIEIFRIPFSFFYSFYFILRSRATSVDCFVVGLDFIVGASGYFECNFYGLKFLIFCKGYPSFFEFQHIIYLLVS